LLFQTDQLDISCSERPSALHGNSSSVQSSEKTADVKAWIKVCFDNIGEHMPHTKQIHLPSFMTIGEVYQQKISEMEELE